MNGFFARKITSKLMMTSALVAAGTLTLSAPAHADYSWSNLQQTGGTTFETTNPTANITNINVTTASGRGIGVGNADIYATDTVNVNGGLFVVRDNRANIGTQILGKLTSNGKIIVIDQNGVMFGKDSVVDVQSIVATTGNISDANLLNNANSPLLFSNFGNGVIENQGSISVADSGLVAFVAPTVKNSGVINANLGRVSLTAGKSTATVDLYGDGLVELAASSLSGLNDTFLSENTGTVTAAKIQMTAGTAKSIADSVVNMQGVLTANSVTKNSKGEIVLSAGTVKLGGASKSASVKGNTKVNATQLELGLTVDGAVSGSSKAVNVLSSKAKISQAIGFVAEQGTVDIAAGTYNDHLVVDKAGVTIRGAKAGVGANDKARGAGETVVIPNSPGITVTADNVTIDGMNFSGATGADGYGIFVNGADNVSLLNNVINGNAQSGIYGNDANNLTISGNTITNTLTKFFGAIKAAGGSNWNVSNNYIEGGYYGISLVDVAGTSTITGNTVNNMKVEGVHLENVADVTVSGNTIGNPNGWTNGNGIHVQGPNGNVVITGNTLERNKVGVLVEGSDNVEISDNTINRSYMDAIRTDDASGTVIDGNTIFWVGDKGVKILGGSDVTVENNTFDTVFGNAIWGNGVDNVDVINNTATNVYARFNGVIFGNGGSDWLVTGNQIDGGYYGVTLADISGVTALTFNTILNTKVEGVHVEGLENVVISNNTIGNPNLWTNSNGIHVEGSGMGQTMITGNNLERNKIGIFVDGANDVMVIGNSIRRSYLDGVRLTGSDNSVVSGNSIFWTGDKGVRILGGSNITVGGNTLDTIYGNAIHGSNVIGANITGNVMTNVYAPLYGVIHGANGSDWNVSSNRMDSGFYGVNLTNVGGVNTINNNNISNMKVEGVHAGGLSDVAINGNIITNSAVTGIHTEDVTGTVTIQDNTINNSGENGIYLEATGNVPTAPQIDISGNNIINGVVGNGSGLNGFAAIRVSAGQDSNVAISDNTLANQFEYGLYATSGEIDLTGATNTIQNTNIGMGFYPDASIISSSTRIVALLAPDFVALGNMLRLTGNTIGTTAFVDQTTAFVDLGLGAFFEPGLPTLLNGLDASYTIGGSTIAPSTTGGEVTQAQYDTLETMFNHYNDSQDRGLFFFPIADDLTGTFDQEDVFRTFAPLIVGSGAGSLTITGLPLVAPGATVTTTASAGTPFNPALIEPAAGDESGDGSGAQVADIQPAAGEANNSSCWADATTSLGQGSAVTFNFNVGPDALLQDAVNCGTGATTPGQGT